MKGIVACPQPEAAEVGRQALLNGGNCVDAAIATAFAQFIVDPQMCGVGGWGGMQIYHAPTQEHICIEFYGRAPLKATPDMFAKLVKRPLRFDQWELEEHVNQVGHLSVTCPGTILGLWEAHRRYGSRPWRELVEPAIKLAEDGFIVPGELADLWRRPSTQDGSSGMNEIISATPASRKIYFKADGEQYSTGETFRNPDYANTLREIAVQGPDVLYKGWMAKKIAEDFAQNGGLLSEEDFRSYKVGIGRPVAIEYRGNTVAGLPPPCSGAQVAEILHILEGFGLSEMGFGTLQFFHTMASAQKASFADRVRYLADPAFQHVPVEDVFLSHDRASYWREKILQGESIDVPAAAAAEPAHTTTVSAIDEEGTAIALTHSLSTPASGVVVEGLGFMFNNGMQAFHPYPGHPNSISPGKSRITGMSPTIVFKEGQPWLVASSLGATRILTGVLQVVVNMIDFEMTPVEAVSAPRVHCEQEQLDLEPRAYFALKDELKARGYNVVKSGLSYDAFFSLVHVASRDPATGRLNGAADPRGRGGLAIVD
jgi:gamma-glutamyltranspeptidase/glutathione hydrolase